MWLYDKSVNLRPSLWTGSLFGEKNSKEREGKGGERPFRFSLSLVPRSTKGLFTGYLRPSSWNLLESLNCISLNMYLASALRFVSDDRTQVLIRTSLKRPPQKRILSVCLPGRNRTTGVLFPREGPDAFTFWQRIYCLPFRKPRAKCKRTQNCWPTSRNNSQRFSGCYMLRPFARPVACCCVLLGVVAPFAYHCNKDATTRNIVQHCCWCKNVGSCCSI